MATIRRFPNKKFWYAVYRDAGGGQHTVTTRIEHSPEPDGQFSPADPEQVKMREQERGRLHAENRGRAKQAAIEWEEAERGNATDAQLRAMVSRLSKRIRKRGMEFQTVREYLNQWHSEKRGTPSTLTRYKGTVEQFLRAIGGKANVPISEISPEDVDRFTKARLSQGIKESTVVTDFNSLKGAFSMAQKRGYILTNPFHSAQQPNAAQEQKAPFTVEEIQALLRATKGEEWETVILIATYTGLRLSDACELTWDKIDLPRKKIVLRPRKTQKKKVDVVIPLHPKIEAHLMGLAGTDNPTAPVCPALWEMRGGGKSGRSGQFARRLARAGIEQESIAGEGDKGRRFNRKTFHSLRHSYTTLLESAGVAEDVRMQLSAHSDRKTHAGYVHTKFETLKNAVATLPTI